MPDERDSDATDLDPGRRRLLQGLAATGVGLAGFGRAGASEVPGTGGGRAASDERLPFAGFEHTATGSADLAVEDGSLLVHDAVEGGVTATVGEAESFVTQTGFDPDTEAGSYREFVGRGVVDGDPGQPVGRTRLVRTDGEFPLQLEPDFRSVGAEGFGMDVYRGGDLVHQGEYGYTPCPIDPPILDIFDIVVEWVWTGAGWKLVVRWVLDIDIFPPDDDEGITGDEIHVYPLEPQAELGPVTHVDTLGEGHSEFRVDGEQVGFGGHDVEQVGDAQLHPVDGGSTLGVTDLGEGGGVAIGTNAEEGLGMSMQPTELPADGSRLAGRPRGLLDGTDRPLGEAGLTREGDAIVVDGDFTPLETDGVGVTLFNGEEIVEELTFEAGELGFVEGNELVKRGLTWPPWPTCPPWCPPWPPRPPWPPWCEFVFGQDGDPVPLPAVFDGEEFEADRIRVRAVDPGIEPEALTATEVVGTNLEELAFVDEPPSFP